MAITVQQVETALSQYQDPYYPEQSWLSRKVVKNINIDGNNVDLVVELDYPAAGIEQILTEGITNCLQSIETINQVNLALGWQIAANKSQTDIPSMANIKNIIAVASGKGGVGKSTTAVNLALALQSEGARVGLLDADIYGPSQPLLLGVPANKQPEQKDGQYFLPIEAFGLQTMSIGYLVTEKTPMVWRGPMVSGALQQLLGQTLWHDLDYLIVDMPPGTGDIQLTLSQKVPVAGAVIVTTPQDLALLDAKKGIEMFRKVDIPVLGVIENMALHTCSQCGHEERLFGEGGGKQIAEQYQASLLGSLPLDIKIREQADAGVPSVIEDPQSKVSLIYREMARSLGANLAKRSNQASNEFPKIVIRND